MYLSSFSVTKNNNKNDLKVYIHRLEHKRSKLSIFFWLYQINLFKLQCSAQFCAWTESHITTGENWHHLFCILFVIICKRIILQKFRLWVRIKLFYLKSSVCLPLRLSGSVHVSLKYALLVIIFIVAIILLTLLSFETLHKDLILADLNKNAWVYVLSSKIEVFLVSLWFLMIYF